MDSSEQLAIFGGHPVRRDLLVYARPALGDAEIRELIDTVRSDWITTGPKVLKFESILASMLEVERVKSVSSCTAGLHLLLLAAGVQPGGEVVVPAITWASTANVVVHTGAVPIFADVDVATMNVTADTLDAAISERTRAVLPVHLGGRPVDLDEIGQLAGRRGLFVIDDAAHALGARVGRSPIGGGSTDGTAFSFYATKNATTAEGGAVTTPHDEWLDQIEVLSYHGLSKDASQRSGPAVLNRFELLAPGYKYNLSDLAASIGIHQLFRFKANQRIRARQWSMYVSELARFDWLRLPVPTPPGHKHAMHQFAVLIDDDVLDRDRVQAALQAENIATGIHYHPLHLEPYYANRPETRRCSLSGAEWISTRTLSLPLGPAFDRQDIEDVIEAINKIDSNRKALVKW
jgi:dTDP-4-amino-4,6-dideoxygalactose transaminase